MACDPKKIISDLEVTGSVSDNTRNISNTAALIPDPDTTAGAVGTTGQVLKVNAARDGLEYANDTSNLLDWVPGEDYLEFAERVYEFKLYVAQERINDGRTTTPDNDGEGWRQVGPLSQVPDVPAATSSTVNYNLQRPAAVPEEGVLIQFGANPTAAGARTYIQGFPSAITNLNAGTLIEFTNGSLAGRVTTQFSDGNVGPGVRINIENSSRNNTLTQKVAEFVSIINGDARFNIEARVSSLSDEALEIFYLDKDIDIDPANITVKTQSDAGIPATLPDDYSITIPDTPPTQIVEPPLPVWALASGGETNNLPDPPAAENTTKQYTLQRTLADQQEGFSITFETNATGGFDNTKVSGLGFQATTARTGTSLRFFGTAGRTNGAAEGFGGADPGGVLYCSATASAGSIEDKIDSWVTVSASAVSLVVVIKVNASTMNVFNKTLTTNGSIPSLTGGNDNDYGATIPVIAMRPSGTVPDATWNELLQNTFENTPDLLTKISLFLGTKGTSGTSTTTGEAFDTYNTDGTDYFWFPTRDSNRGQWSSTNNPAAMDNVNGIQWNLIG